MKLHMQTVSGGFQIANLEDPYPGASVFRILYLRI
jgi:hypothetical protein